jgi:hypothetical protein
MVGMLHDSTARPTSRSKAARAADLTRDHATAGTKSARAPLSAAEAELAARMSPLLRRKPRRTAAPISTADGETADVTVLPHTDPDPFDQVVPPSPLPTFADDPAYEAGETTIRTVTWLHHSRRNRLRKVLRASSAWTVTIIVVLATVCAATVALIGVDKSLTLVDVVRTQVVSAIAVIESRISLRPGL